MLQVGRKEIILLVQVNLILSNCRNISGFAHSLHEEQAGDNQAHLDGNSQVEDDGEEEGNQEHGNVALRILHQCQETSPAAHAVRNHYQYTRQTSHRDVLGKRHEEEEDEQQYHSVDDARYRSLTAVVDIGHGTGDGTSGRDTAEERRGDVGQSLGYQLGVGIVMVADYTVGYGSREQALDGTEDGDGDGRRHEALDGLPVHFRNLSRRQLVADREAVADGLDALNSGKLLEQQCHNGHQDDGDERSWNLLAELRSDGDDHHANHTDEGTPRVDGVETLEIDTPFLQEVRRIGSQCQTEEILDLSGEDGYGDTAGETYHDRIRDVLDDGTESEQSEEHQEETCHQRCDGQSLESILLDDAVDDDDECSCRSADLHFASAEDGDDETRYDGCDDTLLGCHARSDTECDGQRQGYDTNDDTCHEVRHECFLVVTLQARKQTRLNCYCLHLKSFVI